MLPDNDARQHTISCLVPPHDAVPMSHPHARRSLNMSLWIVAIALPVLLLSSTPNNDSGMSHGAAPLSRTGAMLKANDLTGAASSVDSILGRIAKVRRKRQAENPGVEPWKPSAPEPPTHADNHTAVYLSIGSANREEFLRETMQKLVDRGETAIVVDVKGGRVHYATNAALPNQLGLVNPYLDVDRVLRIADEYGLYTIARFVALKDDGLSGKVPDTMVKNPKTGAKLSPGWTDPANPTTIEYNTQVMCELAEKGFDEINLDYIRFSTADFGNLRAYSGQEKADRLEAFIKASRETINRCNPQTKLGISTFAIIGWNYDINVETLGQDIKRLAPYVDIISPMAYPATFTSEGYYVPGKHPRSRMYWLVYRTMTGYRDFLGADAVKLRPWIQGYYVDAKDMREQMDAVVDSGSCGFQVWNANNNYGPVYQAMEGWSLPENCK